MDPVVAIPATLSRVDVASTYFCLHAVSSRPLSLIVSMFCGQEKHQHTHVRQSFIQNFNFILQTHSKTSKQNVHL